MKHVLCIGNAVQDFVFSVSTIPTRAEKYRASGFETMGGGPAATAAAAISRLGGCASLVTRLGNDRIAELIVRELQDYGVDCSFARRFDGHTSSLSSVFVDSDGERLIMNHLDPGMPTETGWLPGSLPDGVDAVLADTRWPDGALHMLQTAQQAGVPAVLDGDVPLPVDSRLPEAASHIAFSATGLCEYSDEADPEPGLRKVTDQTGAWCCVTLGSRGTLCCQDGEIVAIPAIAVQPRDTLGAGDVWHGAFSLQLAEGRSALDAARFANAAAAIKVSRSGGRAGAPTRREVEDLVEEISMVHGRVDQI